MPKDGYAGSGPRRCADAEDVYTRALAILDPGPGRESPVVTESLNNLAEIYRIQGRNALAEPLYRRTLGILEKSVSPEHQRVGITLDNLVEVYGAQGRWEDAARITRRWRACWRTTPGCFAARAGTLRRSRSTDAPATHRTQLMGRLDIHDVAGLVRYAFRVGLIHPGT